MANYSPSLLYIFTLNFHFIKLTLTGLIYTIIANLNWNGQTTQTQHSPVKNHKICRIHWTVWIKVYQTIIPSFPNTQVYQLIKVFDGYWLGKTRHIVRFAGNGTSGQKQLSAEKQSQAAKSQAEPKLPSWHFSNLLQIINL